MKMKLILLGLCFAALCNCSETNSQNLNLNSTSKSNTNKNSNLATPNIDKSDKPDKKTGISLNTPRQAIEALIKTRYPKWLFVGHNFLNKWTNEESDDYGFTLDSKTTDVMEDKNIKVTLHLTKNSENKIVTVMVSFFKNKEGNLYWLAYEGNCQDFANLTLNNDNSNE
jgi:hypothetical protein